LKIVYCTDIHDALEDLQALLRETQADLYLLSGDILYKAFHEDEKILQFVTLQEELYELAQKRHEKIYLFDLAADILRFPGRYDRDEDLMLSAVEYRLLFNKAAKIMKEKYDFIEKIIQEHGHAECRLLPGNYDIDLRYTALDSRSMHQKTMTFQGLKIAGYGGAPIATSGIPEKLAVVFHEHQEDGLLYSEPEHFFMETEPDIIMIHNPAYGFLDRIPGLGHVGSQGIRNYLDSHSPSLVLSGHVHEDYGLIYLKKGVVFLNPSNFGGVDSPFGRQEGGAFAEIYFEGRELRRIQLNRLVEGRNHPLLEVDFSEPAPRGRIFSGAREVSHLSLDDFTRDPYGSPMEMEG